MVQNGYGDEQRRTQSPKQRLKVSVDERRLIARRTFLDEIKSVHEKAAAENGKSLGR